MVDGTREDCEAKYQLLFPMKVCVKKGSSRCAGSSARYQRFSVASVMYPEFSLRSTLPRRCAGESPRWPRVLDGRLSQRGPVSLGCHRDLEIGDSSFLSLRSRSRPWLRRSLAATMDRIGAVVGDEFALADEESDCWFVPSSDLARFEDV